MYRRSRSSHTLSSRPWAERDDLRHGFSVKLALRQVGITPFIPVTGFISKSRNHPFEQIGFPQHHREKVLFLVPCFLFVTMNCMFLTLFVAKISLLQRCMEIPAGLEPVLSEWKSDVLAN